MDKLREVEILVQPPARLAPVIGSERMARLEAVARAAREMLAGRKVVNVNSTAVGGGVAEMLQSILAYVRGAGIDTEWVVVSGTPEFFAITKRLHNAIHGSPGDGGPLGEEEHAAYRAVLEENAHELEALLRPGDVALLHDPQTAGLVEPLQRAGVTVAWRSHIGCDAWNEHSERGWDFLRRYVEPADAFVFTREPYAPAWVDRGRLAVIPPSIDPFAPKNCDLDSGHALRILDYVGVVAGPGEDGPVPFRRRDGSPARLDRHADVLQTGPPPPADAPLIVQISRWDRLKDMAGVMEAFVEHVDPRTGAHLLLAGPNVSGVADDPEGAAVLEECFERWRRLPHFDRSRVHLACLPTADVDENAVIVNAIQRHAAAVVQKSLAEGFGLTVAEAMWKRRAIVASRVGGIPDQIEHGASGLLLDDPRCGAAFGEAVMRVLDDRDLADRLGAAAHRRASERFLGDRHLIQYAELLERLVAPA